MNQSRSTTQSPPGGSQEATGDRGQVARGIDWVNLMMISEHAQADVMGRPTAKPERWIFRIELDTEIDNPSDARALRNLLLQGRTKFEEARDLLVSIRENQGDDLSAPIRDLISAAFSDLRRLIRPGSLANKDGETMLQVIEDFGGPWVTTIARAQLDVPADTVDLPQLRKDASGDPKNAKKTLRPLVGKERGERVIDATFD